jgi:hypothetical protein
MPPTFGALVAGLLGFQYLPSFFVNLINSDSKITGWPDAALVVHT